jgi:hypothetical protein
MNENADCIKNCDRVLEKKPNNIKALYRKGQVNHDSRKISEYRIG